MTTILSMPRFSSDSWSKPSRRTLGDNATNHGMHQRSLLHLCVDVLPVPPSANAAVQACTSFHSTRTRSIATNPFFDSVGHALEIGLSHTIWMLASTFDTDFACIPDIRRWEEPFSKLRQANVEGYYHVAALLREEQEFSFADENLPVRVLFSQHIRFAEDRIRRPEFFCWPGLFLVDGGATPVDLHESEKSFSSARGALRCRS